MVVSYSGIAGRRGKNPTRIVLHNDGGSQGATAAFYKSWLENHNPELGFAHEYIASDGTYQAENAGNCAWHCANATGNRDYYGIEICQSLGNEATFKANEQKAFKRAAQLCKQWGLNPSVAIFPLHRELSSTDCPHRSFALHGKSNAAVKQYYVEQVKKYYNGGGTVSKNTYLSIKKPMIVKALQDVLVYNDKERKKLSSIVFKKSSVFFIDKEIAVPGSVKVGQPRSGGYCTLNDKWVAPRFK